MIGFLFTYNVNFGFMLKRVSYSLIAIFIIALTNFLNAKAIGDGELLNFDKTLRLNYIFSGGNAPATISLVNIYSYQGWWGRRRNMDKVLVKGNGRVIVRDSASCKILYINSFSTLFSEWLSTEEAGKVYKGFENVFLVPMPTNTAEITVELYDVNSNIIVSYTHFVNPSDILIKPFPLIALDDSKEIGELNGMKYKYIFKGGDSKECIDIVIVSEGYTKMEEEKFFLDSKLSAEEILSYEPFSTYKSRFNFVAVFAQSTDSGVSIPKSNIWKQTALSSHFSTFYMDRYLTTLSLFKLHDYISIVPYEHIIILANTDNYGGGGIYNSYILSAVDNRWHKPVIVHEFGHSFGALADEYFYDDQVMNQYKSGVEPWEPNITTLTDFESKWKDMLGSDYKIITKEMQGEDYLSTLKREDYKLGIYEGGGYQSKGVYRPYPTCRMRDNTYPLFCPVCERAIKNMILYSTETMSDLR